MIRFYSLKDAISYRKNCPLCSHELQITGRDLAMDIGHDFRGSGGKLSFFIDKYNEDTVVVDLHTEEVEIITLGKDFLDDGSYGGMKSPTRSPTNYPNYNGKFLHALAIECNYCCQYNFRLQIHFDLTPKIEIGSRWETKRNIEASFLDSECISIEEGNMVHEIKNSYASQKTHYSYFEKDGSSKKSTLPLIPLDLDNPKDTVARIRKLLIFS